MGMKLMLGAFLLAVAMVTPSLSFFDDEGPICRYVNSTTGRVINSTDCPFSDMDNPPYVCVNSSSGQRPGNGGMRQGGHRGYRGGRGFRNRRDADGGRGWDRFWRYFDEDVPEMPKIRVDRCQLQGGNFKSCSTDSDCPSSPGLTESRCKTTRRGTKYCSMDVTSVAEAMLCAEPCEIRRGNDVIFRDLTQCRGEDSLWGDSFEMDDEEQPILRVCESSSSMTVRVESKIYDIKTCVSRQRVNNNGGGNIEP